jgi:ubiquinone/menaquinone biosynthesis C-methylase UbiE
MTQRRLATLSLILLAVATLDAQQPRRQPPAKEYIKILEDPHRIERLKPQEIVQSLGLKPGDVVADIGSGSGLFTRPLARTVQPDGKVYAVDIDKELLEHVEKTAKEQDISNITIVFGENDSPRLPPMSLDLAFICDTLHHIENRQSYLANVKPSLKPGGRLVIIDFSDGWPANHDSMKYSLQDLDNWTEAAGYIKVAEFSTIPGNYYRVYKMKT